MLRLLLFVLISHIFTQSIAQKSKSSSSDARAINDNDEPNDSKCSSLGRAGASCVSVFRCPELFKLYKKATKLTQTESKSLKDAYCGYRNGAEYVCCKSMVTSTPDLQCGDSILKDSRSKVTGGKPAKLGAWPWMAALYMNDGKRNSFRCGGSLISKEWVLTAAHCVPEKKNEKLVHVRLGDLNIDDSVKDDATPVDIAIKEVIAHAGYTKKPVYNDIALLRLSEPANYTRLIRPICLHTAKKYQNNSYYDPKKPFIAGWGTTEYLGGLSTHLLDAEIYVKSSSQCTNNYKDFLDRKQVKIDNSIICASAPSKDSCQGDSGGPLMFIEKQTWYQGGIVSVGYECANPDFPGIYTKVAAFTDWINEKTGLNL